MTEPNTESSTPGLPGGGLPASTPSSTGDHVVSVSTVEMQNSLTSLLSASWAVLMPQISESIRQQVSEVLQGAGIQQGQYLREDRERAAASAEWVKG